jgi:hypothetical protein
MFNKISRVAALVTAVLSLLGIMSATAMGTSWTNSGSTAFTATTGAGTLTTSAATLTCSGSTVVGTAGTSGTLPSLVASGTASFSGCDIAGVRTYVVACSRWDLRASTIAGGVTNGTLTVACTISVGGNAICTITGTLTARYTNPPGASPGTGAGKLTTGGSGLVVSPVAGRTCPLAAQVNVPAGISAYLYAVVAGAPAALPWGPYLF